MAELKTLIEESVKSMKEKVEIGDGMKVKE